MPKTVSGFKCSSSTTKSITLKWNKNTSADGYVVEMYKNGQWVKIKTFTSKSSVSLKVSGLKSSTSYSFRIRAYKKFGTAKLYSSYVSKTLTTKQGLVVVR